MALAILMAVKAAAQPGGTNEGSPSARRLVVSIPDRKLALLENGRVLKVYAVAVGAGVSPSPSGEYRIINRVTNPTYYRPGVVIPPGKDNPLGTRWMGLNRKGYGIHGTNEPRSIGRAASHGCIRMRKADLEELFELVRAGDTVVIHRERDSELAGIFGGAPAAQPTLVVAAEAGAAGGQQ